MRSLRLWAGKKLTPFTGGNVFSPSKHNETQAVADCFLNPQVVPNSAGQITITDSGWALQLFGVNANGGSGSGAAIFPFSVFSIGPDSFQGVQLSFAQGQITTVGTIVSVAYPVSFRSAQKPYNNAVITPAIVPNSSILYCAQVGDSATGQAGVEWLWLNTEGMAWWPSTFGVRTLSFRDADAGCAVKSFQYWGSVPQ